MKTFTDNAGRTWSVTINVDAIKRVRGMLDIDLLEVVDGKLIGRLVRDPVLLCDVLYALCQPEATARNISDEEFGRSMAGDAIELATHALLEELADFFPSPKDRANLRAGLNKMTQTMDLARDRAAQRMEAFDPEKFLAEHSLPGDSSGMLPASSE